MSWTPPPNWPQPPSEGWNPPPGWQPDPSWGPPPAGWNFYPTPSGGHEPWNAASWFLAHKALTAVAAVVVLIIVIAAASSGGSSKKNDAAPAATSLSPSPSASASSSSPTPSPSATAAPSVVLQNALESKLGSSNVKGQPRVVSVTYRAKMLSIQWGVNDNLTDGLRKDGAEQDVIDILAIVKSSQHGFPGMNLVGVFGEFPLQNKLGRVKEGRVVTLDYSVKRLNQIDYANVSTSDIADDATFGGISPVLG